MVVIAQLSDIHLTADADGTVGDDTGPVRALRAAVASLLAMPARPDCVVLTGDLAENGLPAEYARLRALLSPLPVPVHPLPGNHDDRHALRQAFADHAGVLGSGGHLQYATEIGGTRLLCCDSTVPGRRGGEMDGERLDWLAKALEAVPDAPTLVALHHPPFRIGIRFTDDMGLADPDPLAAVIARHPQVVRVLSGHVHRGAVTAFAGTVGVTCPSTYRQFYLDLTRPGRAAVTGEPAEFALHVIGDDALAVTHFVHVGGHRALMELD
jgi:3',5'-cyclic AMP phosphodiesterase CpdA